MSDIDRLLELLRDPNVESRDVAAAAGVPREEAARAARLVLGIARAKPEEAVTLPAALALAVSRAALAAGRADLLAALAAHPGKDVAKDAKRGLHLLKARGVAVPEPVRPAQEAPPPTQEAPPPAYATAVDVRGERALWIPRPVPGKGLEIAQVVLSDERGVLELQVGVLGRKEWRALTKGLLDRGAAMGVGEIDRGRAAALVQAARAQNDRAGQRVPEGVDAWLPTLGAGAALADPAAAFPPLPPPEEADALQASGALHDVPLLSSWLPEEDFLREIAAKLDEVSVSPLYVDDRQRAEQLVRTVADAVERYLEGPRRPALSRRLFSIAEHLAAAGDAEHARAAAAAARALAGDAPARTIPFARRLVEKAFPGVAAPPPEAPAAGSSLLVPP